MKELIKLLEEEKSKKQKTIIASIVGAGGKTTLLHGLGIRLKEAGYRVVITTTTMVYMPDDPWLDSISIGESVYNSIIEERNETPCFHFIGEAKPILEGIQPGAPGVKITGISDETIARLEMKKGPGAYDFILIESDGARQLPIKAPNESEPLIPRNVDIVLGVIGLDSVGLKLDEENVHRPERLCRVLGKQPGEHLTPGDIKTLVLHPEGLFKKVPHSARRVLLLNKAEGIPIKELGREIALDILSESDSNLDIYVTSLEQEHIYFKYPIRVSLIVFGAGLSTRMGTQKLLLDINKKPIIDSVLNLVADGGFRETLKHLGFAFETLLVYHDETIKSLGEPYKIDKILWNRSPEEGMSSSLKISVNGSRLDTDGYLFLMGDQPFIDSETIVEIAKVWKKDLSRIVVPYFAGKQGNPVLFSWELKDRLLNATGDKGGREVIRTCLDKVSFCELENERPGMDIDDPGTYRKLKDESI